jgi:hypothetical protein
MRSDPGLLAQAWDRRARPAELIRDGLSSRAAPKVIILVAMLLTSSSLTLGFSVDEYFQRVALREDSNIAGVQREPWNLFTFSTGRAMNQELMEEGIVPWWTDQDFVISFFRPLTSLTLWLDHSLWPGSAPMMHLHSMLWFALLLAAAGAVYREFSGSSRVASLALLLYAIDDARAFPVGWIALRNALIALAPAFLALVTHHRFRSGRGSVYGWLSPLLLLVGLLGGEMAITVYGYLFSYAVFLDRGTLWQRMRSLLPYAAIALIYRVLYNALGHGALHSGLYFDPAREPVAFIQGLFTRLPVLLMSQFALPPADLWELYPMFGAWLRPSVFVVGLLGLALLWLLFRPLLRTSAVTRFWALGCVLSTIPVCGTFPEDRLLTATSLGGAALLATLLLSIFEQTYPNPKRWARAAAGALLVIHALLAPLLLTVRAQDIELMESVLHHADQSIPREPEIEGKTLIMLNPPLNLLAIFFSMFREAKNIPLPERFRWLATGESDLHVERLDAHTLKLRPAAGFLSSSTQRMFRSEGRGFPAGQTIAFSDMSFEVTQLTDDGRPAEVLVRFQKNIDDPSLLWVQWGRHEYVRFQPPRVGRSLVLPKVDPLSILLEAPEKSH